MWNTINNTETKVLNVDKETIIEKTISPDKVVDMYNDVLEKAEKTISRRILIKENNINVSVVEFQPLSDTNGYSYIIRFNLNGKEYIFKKIVDSFERQTLSEGEILALILEYYTQEVTKILQKALFKEASWRIRVNKKEIK
jgi:hypothetical protein